jgi:D-alanyl-D-alanine carboxypeptidase-like protein
VTTLPTMPVTFPAVLEGQVNGKLADTILVRIEGLSGGPELRLVDPAARAWRAMAAAALDDGITLTATSIYDSYRPYIVQYNTFIRRYWPTAEPGYIGERYWPSHRDLQGNWVPGHTWYQKPNTAVAAVPGSSNHGWALAVDVANASGKRLDWLLANAARFGWSWEVQSEEWHIRYCKGDNIPQAVLDYERLLDMDLQCLVRFSDDPVKDRVWLCNRMFRREVQREELVDDVANTAYLNQVIAGTQPATGSIADISSYVGGPLANNSKVLQSSALLTKPNAFGVDVTTFQGDAAGGPVDLTDTAVDKVATATADEIRADPERDGRDT